MEEIIGLISIRGWLLITDGASVREHLSMAEQRFYLTPTAERAFRLSP